MVALEGLARLARGFNPGASAAGGGDEAMSYVLLLGFKNVFRQQLRAATTKLGKKYPRAAEAAQD